MTSKENKTGSTASLTEKLVHPSYEELQQQLTETEQKLSTEEEKVKEHWDRILRMQADTKNMESRLKRDAENAYKYSIEKFALELLPIVDNLERAIEAHLSDPHGKGSLLEGVEMTLKMFHTALQKFSIEQVNPLNEPFNPEFHQAVSTQEDKEVKSGTVLSVLQKGYLLHNRLIRPALVIVSK